MLDLTTDDTDGNGFKTRNQPQRELKEEGKRKKEKNIVIVIVIENGPRISRMGTDGEIAAKDRKRRKRTPLQTRCHQKEGARLRAKLSFTVKLVTGPGEPGSGEPVNRSIFRVGSSTERRRQRGHFVVTPCWTAWTGVKHREMIPNPDSPTVKFAGEPSTGNLYTRFDEGRGGLAPKSTLLSSVVGLPACKWIRLRRNRISPRRDGKKFAGGPCGVKSSGDHSRPGRVLNGGLTEYDFGIPLA